MMLRFEAVVTLRKMEIDGWDRDNEGARSSLSVQVRCLDWQRSARTNGELIDRLDNAFGRDGRKACEIVGAGVAQTAG